MGYTHYYHVAPKFNKDKFTLVSKDFKKIIPWLDSIGIHLKGGLGTGKPIINSNQICFNGDANCNHKDKDLGIAWPSNNAMGVGTNQMYKLGHWFGGRELQTRECGGDCSHETFRLEQEFDTSDYEPTKKNNKYFNFCKTAYKPYDLAVTACLVIAKHHLKTQITIKSDGEMQHWQDAILLCQNVLGYGSDFTIQ